MIKGVIYPGDSSKPVLVLGLSEENWRRLRENKPILVKIEEVESMRGAGLGDIDSIAILGGQTEESIIEYLHREMPQATFEVPGDDRPNP